MLENSKQLLLLLLLTMMMVIVVAYSHEYRVLLRLLRPTFCLNTFASTLWG